MRTDLLRQIHPLRALRGYVEGLVSWWKREMIWRRVLGVIRAVWPLLKPTIVALLIPAIIYLLTSEPGRTPQEQTRAIAFLLQIAGTLVMASQLARKRGLLGLPRLGPSILYRLRRIRGQTKKPVTGSGGIVLGGAQVRAQGTTGGPPPSFAEQIRNRLTDLEKAVKDLRRQLKTQDKAFTARLKDLERQV